MKYNDAILNEVNNFIADQDEFTVRDIVLNLREKVNDHKIDIDELGVNTTSNVEVQTITHKDVRDRFEELKSEFIDKLDVQHGNGYRVFVPKAGKSQDNLMVNCQVNNPPDDSSILNQTILQKTPAKPVSEISILDSIVGNKINRTAILVENVLCRGHFHSLNGRASWIRKSDATNALHKYLEHFSPTMDKEELRKTVKTLFKSGKLSFDGV